MKMNSDKKKEYTTIQIKRNIANKLKKMLRVGVTYDDIITDLIDYYHATR